jgi:hypothetical protein
MLMFGRISAQGNMTELRVRGWSLAPGVFCLGENKRDFKPNARIR